MTSFYSIQALRISLASPQQIRDWSSGEVTKAETINYRTLKPEPGGLCCERIFGPTRDWTCACGKYRRYRHKGITCKVCGVMVATSRVRRSRMGHIELAAPVSHVWFAQGTPNRMALLLNMPPRMLDAILSYTCYFVLSVDEQAQQTELERVSQEICAIQEKYAIISRPTSLPSQTQSAHSQALAYTTVPTTATTALLDVSAQPALLQCEAEYAEQQQRLKELKRYRQVLERLKAQITLSNEEYRLLQHESSCLVKAGTGAAVIEQLLTTLDLEQLACSLQQDLHSTRASTRTRAARRLKLVNAFRQSRTQAQWMILRTLPVLPPDLRPVMPVGKGRFASTDINELYRRVLDRNNRLKQLQALGMPEIMLNREQHALQTAVDALLDNGRLRIPQVGPQRRPLHSLSDLLRGKRGHFRRYMLGKRVDYSGRSVIAVGPTLQLHECGLPRTMALELFKPFVIQKLLRAQIVTSQVQAQQAIAQHHPAVWDLLDDVVRHRVVLLNRAPTLHRSSIQAFEPVLIDGNVLTLHPLVCAAFNADFDGDQMAVHVPLTPEAQNEARTLLLSTHNLLSPATGEPSISINQDMVLGCYYLTQEVPEQDGEPYTRRTGHTRHIFADTGEALLAYANGAVTLQAPIEIRIQDKAIFTQSTPTTPIRHVKGSRIQTTVGRLIFNQVLPKKLRFINYTLKKEDFKYLLRMCLQYYGPERAAKLADAIKQLGFTYATRSGLSLALYDLPIPAAKPTLLATADAAIQEYYEQWRTGLCSDAELHAQTIAIWSATTEEVEQQVQQALDPTGPLTAIARSGATKARLQQMRQLSGMRGLMVNAVGEIVTTPVRGNFVEGLTVSEYFLSSHGARKSLMDRALNTAAAGYLTSRLVSLAQDVIVTTDDCGATAGRLISLRVGTEPLRREDLRARLFGCTLVEALPACDLAYGAELDDAAIERLLAAGISHLHIRSVLTCQEPYGVCRACYGWDLATHATVKVGTAVGIIAAQSIGEPGTQLTMRTFHSGGIARGQEDITQGLPQVEALFEARTPQKAALHDILRLKGVADLEEYMLREIMCIYQLAGISLHEKHFAVILRQLLRYVYVDEVGDTMLVPGSNIDRFKFMNINAQTLAQGGAPAIAHVVLLGLTHAALATESWLAAASFQQTTRVLTEAVLEGRTDNLRGLKENVMLGRLIPAGTGLSNRIEQLRRPIPQQRRRGRKKKS